MNLLSITKITGIAGVPDPGAPGLFAEIVVGLPKREIRLRCDAEGDALVHSGGRKRKRADAVPILEGIHRVECLWALTNPDGVFDGLRLQVAAKGAGRVLEILAVEGGLEVCEARLCVFKPARPRAVARAAKAKR